MNRLARSSVWVLCCLAWPVLLGARGCEPDPVPIGGDECDVSRCGPALGLPSILCGDGSMGGSTGRCLASADGTTCGWEVRECPADPCTPALCGTPPPTVPSTQLSCERVADGTCEWIVSGDPTCTPASCGPAPGTPTFLCADGSTGGFTGRCIPSAGGTCGWEIVTCDPATECTLAECGPMPGAPAFVCPDGSIGGNTGRCLRDPSTAQCGWEQRTCPSTTTCGTIAGLTCAAGEQCFFGVGDCRVADAGGVCSVPPEVCTAEWAPVCGCDDHTYSNVCDAHGRGVSILHDGECVAESTSCGGFAGFTCRLGQYCHYPLDPTGVSCGAADGLGQCENIPDVCPAIDAPVCGCDGVTYSSDCNAAGAGTSVAHDGPCGASFACGSALHCTTGAEYCDVVVGGAAGSMPRYACTALPTACASSPSCASCFPGSGGGTSCTEAGPGEITNTLFAP